MCPGQSACYLCPNQSAATCVFVSLLLHSSLLVCSLHVFPGPCTSYIVSLLAACVLVSLLATCVLVSLLLHASYQSAATCILVSLLTTCVLVSLLTTCVFVNLLLSAMAKCGLQVKLMAKLVLSNNRWPQMDFISTFQNFMCYDNAAGGQLILLSFYSCSDHDIIKVTLHLIGISKW